LNNSQELNPRSQVA
jgi:DNA-binding response OmpR family regulator